MTLQVIPPMDENGNINIHNKDGGEIKIILETDISASSFVLNISDGTSVPLVNGSDIYTKVLNYSEEQFSALLGEVYQFALVDETSSPHNLILEGEFRVRGFS